MVKGFEIRDVNVRKVLDSRGRYTIEADIYLDGAFGRCSAPSGASTGATEVIAFSNKGIDSSIEFFNSSVKSSIIGRNSLDQRGFDRVLTELDGTYNFGLLGGNMATALSIANAKASACKLGIPLYSVVGGSFVNRIPWPLGNVIGGGKHSTNGTTIQEFHVAAHGDTFLKSIHVNSLVHRKIGEVLSAKFPNVSIGVGDERAWTASISDEEAIDILKDATEQVSGETGVKIDLGMDLAATSFYEKGKYVYRNSKKSEDEQIDYVKSLVNDYGFALVEDPLYEDAFEGFAEITKAVGNRCLIVGDDLYTTNTKRIERGIEEKSTNAILIKVNQIGTLTSTYEAVDLATRAGMENVVSHRSGETTDDFIAHLAVAFSSKYIKSGIIGGERLSKLNELVRIEEEISR
ncbi:enolase [uncultured archaeon]|nr:enolase [uncultured archaeon]HKJ96452.1 phosphopyruvate hydratase [Thermoplasmataceae archaeon]